MEEQTEIILTSIWKYQEAGVQRVLTALRSQHPKGHYAFDKENGWFRIFCDTASIQDVQASFHRVHQEIEDELQEKATEVDMVPENKWFTPPSPSDLPSSPDPLDKPDVDRQCPVLFDKYRFSRVWTRAKELTPEQTTVNAFISPGDLKEICTSCGTFGMTDQTGRMVYLGGDSLGDLDKVAKKLENMLIRYMFVMPPPKHLINSEVPDGVAYHVDTRYMAHVNMGMLTSTIFDPYLYNRVQMAKIFKAVFARGVCLRICMPEHFKRFEVSFFGPKAKPAFKDMARTLPLWLKDAQFVAKDRGMPSIGQSTTTTDTPEGKQPQTGGGPSSNGHGQNATATANSTSKENSQPVSPTQDSSKTEEPIEEQFDLLGLGSDKSDEKPAPAPKPVAKPAAPPPPPPGSGKHSYQMRMLWEFMNNSSPPESREGSRASDVKPKEAKPDSGPLAQANANSNKASADEKLITPLGDNSSAATPLIDAPPVSATAPSSNAESDEAYGPLIPVPCQDPLVLANNVKPTRSSSRRTVLGAAVRKGISKLLADLPYRKGQVRLQAELGRIYIMDANPTGLAFNAPGERANGWAPNDLIVRLSATCASPESVVFSKGLSIFANDIEQMIGPFDSEGNSLPSSAWALHEKRTVYEFKCQRFYMMKDGTPKAQSPFLVEIDGTRPDEFSYSIRRIEDPRPPLWIHCIRRHWDARVLVSYSPTEKLEMVYGDFARELLRSLVVHPARVTLPKFEVDYDHSDTVKDGRTFCTKILSARIRNIARFIGNEDQSFLDVSWNRLMALEKRAGKSPLRGTLLATPARDDPSRGVFTCWYEASVLSKQAKEAFRENETLATGGAAAWGSDRVKQDSMFAATVEPALDLVKKMDGVGVLIDNGQERTWTPPMRAPSGGAVVDRFW